jgi:hypothetical protein
MRALVAEQSGDVRPTACFVGGRDYDPTATVRRAVLGHSDGASVGLLPFKGYASGATLGASNRGRAAGESAGRCPPRGSAQAGKSPDPGTSVCPHGSDVNAGPVATGDEVATWRSRERTDWLARLRSGHRDREIRVRDQGGALMSPRRDCGTLNPCSVIASIASTSCRRRSLFSPSSCCSSGWT